MNGVSNCGYNWSSTISGTSGVCLDIYTAGPNPSSTPGRAIGLQLRCLSE
ncbi:hypothetical protein [uncultured Rikenella sp.]|nr:hypothetical protein [uncultured Rikenella sp.]